MAHIHSVFDSNEHFVIDPVTRSITNSLAKKIVVMQFDHNSERFTFKIPKVDGHNMANCDRVEIHYINVDAVDKTLKSTGVYEVDDIQPSPDDNSVAVFSWLLSRNCTKYAGTLSFLIHFACTTEGVEDYAWNTAIFQSITIGNGMNNGAEVIEPYADIIAKWKADLFGVGDTQEQRLLTVSAEQQAAIAAKGVAVLDSIPDEYEALQAGVDTLFNSVASGIRGNISGAVVMADDVSQVEHEMIVKAHGKNLFGLNGRTVGDFGGYDTTTQRTFVGNCIYVGISASNYYDYQKCSYTYDEENDLIEITTTKAWYGVGIDFKIKPNTTYFVSGEIPDGCFISVTQFDANGNNLGYQHCKDNTFKTNVNADWVVAILSCQITDTVYTFAKIQIEEGETATEYTPYINPETVTVRRCGKNLFPMFVTDTTFPKGSYTKVQEDGSVLIHNAGDNIRFDHTISLPPGTYVLSNGEMTKTDNLPYIILSIGGAKYYQKQGFTLTEQTECGITIYGWNEYTGDFVFYPQIEIGTEQTEFEAYKGEEYTPGADGVVPGVVSVSPTMTIVTDTPGAMVECEYIVDTKTYIDNKIKELKGSE